MPHGLLCQHRGRAVGRLDHLQDPKKLCLPAGDEVSQPAHGGFRIELCVFSSTQHSSPSSKQCLRILAEVDQTALVVGKRLGWVLSSCSTFSCQAETKKWWLLLALSLEATHLTSPQTLQHTALSPGLVHQEISWHKLQLPPEFVMKAIAG